MPFKSNPWPFLIKNEFSTSRRRTKNLYYIYDLYKIQQEYSIPNTSFSGNTNLIGTAEDRAKAVFGTATTGAERANRAKIEAQNETKPHIIAGITIPPKPSEPEDCCMSGCVNCVWNVFRDDLEEWQAARKEVAKKLLKMGQDWPKESGLEPPKFFEQQLLEMKNNKGTQKSHSEIENLAEEHQEDEWEGIDPSTRAFMETERKLKAKKSQMAQHA